MVETGSENQSHAEAALQSVQTEQANNSPLSLLGRQLSIYSLTLDEFQHTLSDGGKNFGSMNMDEFLNSIWTAEENQPQPQQQAAGTAVDATTATTVTTPNAQFPTNTTNIVKQLSLSRQVTLTLPPPFFQKTVDEVWSEIEQQQNTSFKNTNSTHRQPTFGEMTLEDFLIKAGIELIQEQSQQTVPLPQPLAIYPSNNAIVGSSYMNNPLISPKNGGGGAGATLTQSCIVEASLLPKGGKRRGGYQTPTLCYSEKAQKDGGGYGTGLSGSSVSPMYASQLDNANQYGHTSGARKQNIEGANQYGDTSGTRKRNIDSANQYGDSRGPRKRNMDGTVEVVVERRQRRMIKNRESAAMSRARKQAYTVELETELNRLQEENYHLRQCLAEMEIKEKHQQEQQKQEKMPLQCFEELKMKAGTEPEKAKEKMKRLRRNMSCPY